MKEREFSKIKKVTCFRAQIIIVTLQFIGVLIQDCCIFLTFIKVPDFLTK